MSEIRATTISDAAGTGPIALTGQSAAKAWSFFDLTGTASLDGSMNVASLTDVGVGKADLNWTSAFSDALYSSVGSGRSEVLTGSAGIQTVSSVRVGVQNPASGAATDDTNNSTSHFGDLA